MKKKHYLLIAALSLSLTTAAAATLAACKSDDTALVELLPNVTGTYYLNDNGTEKTLELGVSSFVLNFGEGEKTGWYGSFENGMLQLVFDNGETATAVFNGSTLTLSYNGKTYTLYLAVNYTVTFNVDGGSEISMQSVKNGQTATRPTTNPTRENSVFIDWYTDDTFTTPFDFNTPITANTTIYAKFITIDATLGVYTATFDLGEGVDESYGTVKTVNRVLYNLPEAPSKDGNKFLGWWVSNYYDREKLSTKYEGQEIYEDTVLYAVWASDTPAISVTKNGASWSVNGTNKTFDVSIKDAAGNELASNRSASTSITFDFTAQDAGDYTVEVTVDGNTATAYYKNKGLARVTKFAVEDDYLGFLPIEADDKYLLVDYYIDFECGDAGHNHVHQKLEGYGFDFSACAIGANGYRARITAEAVGYASSVSEWYSFDDRSLAEVTGFEVDQEHDLLKWNKVEHAKSYALVLSNGTDEISLSLTENYYDLRSLNPGNWTFTITPVNNTYHAPEATTCSYTKIRLASPVLTVANNTITWEAVDGATGYELYINGALQDGTLGSDTTTFAITEELFGETGVEYAVTVIAKGDTAEKNSLASDAVYIHGELGEITYSDGKVSWDAVTGIVKYGVKVGDAEEIFVNTTELAITFTKSGTTVITVTCYVNEDEEAGSSTTSVEVYTVKFETNGGTKIPNQYKADGDTVTLPEAPSRLGYEFLGWYNLAENGVPYEDATFTLDANFTTVYAHWEAQTYKVKLVVGPDGTLSDDAVTEFEVTFGDKSADPYPVPECLIEGKEFMGWFTASSGGFQVTDNLGYEMYGWNIPEDTTLYAQWGNSGVLYELISEKEGYTAKKSKEFNNLATVTVLASYKGLPVTAIAANAFEGCSSVTTIRIPSSLKTIHIASYGPYSSGSSFYGLSGLEKIEVYDVGGERFYDSVDGALYSVSNDEIDELIYVPKKKNITGSKFTVAEGTKRIGTYALSGFNEVEEFVIPSSVTYIANKAFQSNYKMKRVTFKPAEDGALGADLEIATAFNNCYALTEIHLPKRLISLAADAFNSGTPIQNIYIDELGTGKDRNTNFYDLDGVLCKADALVLYPKMREGAYQTPSGVARIGEAAFKGITGLTSITFLATVKEIDIEAFHGCTGLRKITFDQNTNNNDLTIKERAFYNCSGLESVTLPPNLKTLEANAFGGTSLLKTVTVNANRADLNYANGAFASTLANATTYVESLYLGENVRELNLSGVFGTKLQEIHVDKNNPYYYEDDGVIFDGAITRILFFPDTKTEFVIDDRMEVIGNSLFKNKTSLLSVTIGKGVRKIEASAFEGCTSLETVIFAEGGTESLTIEERAFYECKAIKTLEFNGRGKAEITIGEKAFATAGSGILQEITLPEGVTSLGKFALSNRSNLRVVNLPSTLETMESLEVNDFYPTTSAQLKSIGVANTSVFAYCNQIEAINVAKDNTHFASIDGVLFKKEDGAIKTLLYAGKFAKGGKMPAEYKDPNEEGDVYGYLEVPETVSEIADYALYGNYYLTRLEFKGTHETFALGAGAFTSAIALQYVTIPSGIAELTEGLFKGCSSLKEVIIPNTVQKICKNSFADCKTLEKVIFAEGNDENELVIEDGVYETHEAGASTYYTTTGAFFNCTSLKEIKFPARLGSIGNYAFCVPQGGTANKLATVEIPVTVTKIGEGAFRSCAAITSIKFTGEVEGASGIEIGKEAFRDCTFNSITLPDCVTSIGDGAFSGTKITEFTVPSKVTTLGIIGKSTYSTNGMTALTTLKFATYEKDGKQVNDLTTLGSAKSGSTTNGTFNNLPNLKSINLEACTSLKEISEKAFEKTGLTSVKIPYGLTTIGISAFENSISLRTLTIMTDEGGKSTLSTIQDYAFRYTALEEFTFPTLAQGALTLGKCLFEGCANLTKMRISSSVQDIGAALNKAPNLQNITVDEGSGVIIDAKNNLLLTKKENGNYTISSAFAAVPLDKDGRFTVPSSYQDGKIDAIGASAFAGQNAMRIIALPAEIREIGDKAFSQCRGLERVEFAAEGLVKIGDYAFEHTYSLKSITIPNSVKWLGSYAFNISQVEEVTMPDELLNVGINIFNACTNLKTVNNISKMTLTNNDVTFGSGAKMFYGCTALKNVTFAKDTTEITSYMFQGCTALESIDLTQITSVAGYAYKGSTVQIRTAEGVFYGCTGLREVIFDANFKTLPCYMFYNCSALKTIYRSDKLKAEDGDTYRTTNENKVDLSQLTTFGDYYSPSTTTAYGAFYGCSSIEAVDIRNTTTFTNQMFVNCSSLETVTLAGGGYTALPYKMFSGCASLETVNYFLNDQIIGNSKEVTLHDNIEFLGQNTFQNSGILKVTIPTSVKNIGKNADAAAVGDSSYLFDGCAKLKEVILPSGLKKLGAYVFRNCAALDTIITATDEELTEEKKKELNGKLPTGLDSIGQECFLGCTSLEYLDLSHVATFGSKAFQNCTALKEADLSAATTVATYLFESCSSLNKVTLGNSLTALQLYMFQNCTSLTSIDLNKVTAIGSNTANSGPFQNCTSLTTVTMDNCKTIGAYVFYGCSALKTIDLSKVTSIGNYAFSKAFCGDPATIDLSAATTINQHAFDGCTSLQKVNNLNKPSLATYAFAGCSSLVSIDLSKVTAFGTYAFQNCTSLKEVDLSAGSTMQTYLFDGCTSLGTVTLGNNIKTLANYMFRGCTSLESIDLKNVTNGGTYTFQNCTGLTTVTLGSLKSLGNYLFNGCSGLQTIDLSAVTSVGTYVFQGCTSLTTATLSACTSVGTYAFQGCSNLQTVDLSSCTSIGSDAFKACSKLEEIELGEGLKSLANQTFLNCSSLLTITIPASVTSIGTNLFVGCNQLTVMVDSGNTTFGVNEMGWLVNKSNGTVLYIPAKTLGSEGSSLTEINFADGAQLTAYMFNGYGQVTKISLPSDLTAIADYAFWNFKGSFGADFKIPASVTTIGNYAFYQTTKLTEIVIPEGVTSIGNYAFANITTLQKVTLPSTLTSIGTNAFQGCTALSQIVYPATIGGEKGLTIGNYAFNGCSMLEGDIVLPEGVATLGTNVFQGTAITGVTLPATLTSIGNYAFADCAEINKLTFANGLATIGTYAFQGTAIASLTLPSTLTSIGNYAFSGCASLVNVTFNTGLQTIGQYSFQGCTKLQSITIPYTVTKLDVGAFYGCTALANVTFDATPEGVDEVALTFGAGTGSAAPDASYLYVDKFGVGYKGVFVGCTALKSIELPVRLKEINTHVFLGSGLEKVTLPVGLTTIGGYSFMYTPLKSITIPYTVTSLGNKSGNSSYTGAFAGCEELTEVIFQDAPEGIEPAALTMIQGTSSSAGKIGAGYAYHYDVDDKYYTGTFVGTTKLESITLPSRLAETYKWSFAFSGVKTVNLNGVVKVSDETFLACAQLTNVIMPDGTTALGSGAFKNCTALQNMQIANSLETISSSFVNCTSIMELIIPAATKVSLAAFEGWTAQQKVLINLAGAEFNATDDTQLWASNAFNNTKAQFGVTGVTYGSDED